MGLVLLELERIFTIANYYNADVNHTWIFGEKSAVGSQ
jgi:hypothetical protein